MATATTNGIAKIGVLTVKAQTTVRKSARAALREVQGKTRWHVVDAKGYPVGKLAAAIAPVLRGKHKPIWEKQGHEGDFVVVLNAAQIHFTGKKWDQKLYRRHSGYPGGLHERTAREHQRRKPGDVLRKAVWGMLPKNKIQTKMMSRLRIFPGTEHPHGNCVRAFAPLWSPLDHLREMDYNPYSKPAFRPVDPDDPDDDPTEGGKYDVTSFTL